MDAGGGDIVGVLHRIFVKNSKIQFLKLFFILVFADWKLFVICFIVIWCFLLYIQIHFYP